ncbi:MAG: LacI family DNA-binding transcriptional regulator [Acholeplasmataceae bacterium]|jgi:LacI family transcriptional regulator|nr:LacI family DNA-binding transcriptional regulator [Acholeplasmataceae bacterium]
MSKKTSMQDIADKLNISRMTVSKAFKNDTDISSEMKDKVRLMAQEMGYKYVKNDKVDLIVLVPEVFLAETEDFYTTLFRRLNENANTKNINLLLKVVNKNDEKQLNIDFSTIGRDGIIMLGQFEKNYVIKVAALRLPLICVDFYYDDLDLDSIVSNNFNAGYIATKYLIKEGHKSIGFVGSIPSTNSIIDRYLGYTKAKIEYQINHENIVVDDRDENGSMIPIYLPDKLPTAFLCNNDHVAYLLIKKLQEKGIHVPNDVSVVGFDDVIYSKISNPSITTMKVSRKYMAEQAIMLMLRRIKNRNAKLINMSLECLMVERDSVMQKEV